MNIYAQRPTPLHFWQQNVNKSLISQLDLLNQVNPKAFNLVFIQETHINFLNLTRANPNWTVVYPSQHHSSPNTTQSVTLVSTSVSKNKWKQVHVQSTDITAIELTGDFGSVSFYNVYNACENSDTLFKLQDFWNQRHPPQRSDNANNMVWVGDFNRHHPLWDDPSSICLFTPANLDAASVLVNLVGTFGMEMPLLVGIPTLETFRTGSLLRPDNVFCSAPLSPAFIECQTRPELHLACTDHFPITGTLDLTPERSAPPAWRNWKSVQWGEF